RRLFALKLRPRRTEGRRRRSGRQLIFTAAEGRQVLFEPVALFDRGTQLCQKRAVVFEGKVRAGLAVHRIHQGPQSRSAWARIVASWSMAGNAEARSLASGRR